MPNSLAADVAALTAAIIDDYGHGRAIDNVADLNCQPDRDTIFTCIQELFGLIYPGFFRPLKVPLYNLQPGAAVLVEQIFSRLSGQIGIALRVRPEWSQQDEALRQLRGRELTRAFLAALPHTRALLDEDLQATFAGDPAACDLGEIILCYPGMFAITVYRLAHVLYTLGVPLIPRLMTEYAHSRSGIDIHPGARIGHGFCIDHGTGIVIGQSTEIGDAVKIYQGVTLGALSTQGGQSLHNRKRHPTIEDRVTIYANATVLGGNTIIGHDSVIGGGAFVVSSVAPGMRVTVATQEQQCHENRASPPVPPV